MSDVAASFVLPPMTRTADVAAVESWIGDPDAPSRILIAEGRAKPTGALVWIMVEQWRKAGLVHLFATPDAAAGGWQWVAERVEGASAGGGAPVARGGAAREPAAPDGSPVSDCIFRAIKRAANMERPAPSLADLARIAGLKSAANAKYYVDKLKLSGRIAIDTRVVAGGERRRFAVLDTHGVALKRTEWGR